MEISKGKPETKINSNSKKINLQSENALFFVDGSNEGNTVNLIENKGLTKENLKQNYKLNDRFFCILCLKLLNEPVQANCGCRFCNKCFDDYVSSGNTTCPSKLKDCNDFNPNDKIRDRAIDRDMKKININCINEGCITSLSLSRIYIHLEICGYSLIDCSLCFSKILLRNQREHVSSLCKNRLVKCSRCLEELTCLEYEKVHFDLSKVAGLCENFPAGCPNKCSSEIFPNIKLHLNVDCSKNTKLKHKSETMFGKENGESHQNNKIIDDLIVKLENIENAKYLTHSNSLNSIRLQENIENELNSLKTELGSVKDALQHTEVDKTNSLFVSSSFLWKLKDFDFISLECKAGKSHSFLSTPFYTKEIGYKLYLKLFPNGDGEAKGTHLSVYISIGKGKYDPLLTWPFSHRFSLQLLNQNQGKNFIEKFKPDPKSICYSQPDGEMNPPAGNSTFISLDNLLKNDDYVKNKILFIKCEIYN